MRSEIVPSKRNQVVGCGSGPVEAFDYRKRVMVADGVLVERWEVLTGNDELAPIGLVVLAVIVSMLCFGSPSFGGVMLIVGLILGYAFLCVVSPYKWRQVRR